MFVRFRPDRFTSARPILIDVIAGLASALAGFVNAAEVPLGPVVRFWRLARLKARVGGSVAVTMWFDGVVWTGGRLRLHLGEHCLPGRRVFLEACNDAIRIGANVLISSGKFIVAESSASLERYVHIGEQFGIRDADHGMAPQGPSGSDPTPCGLSAPEREPGRGVARSSSGESRSAPEPWLRRTAS
jgi:hypothetical protein